MITECSNCKYSEADFREEPCKSCVSGRNFSPVVDSNTVKEIRDEAIKELAGKIQKHCTSIELNEYINTLVEEMVGESNG